MLLLYYSGYQNVAWWPWDFSKIQTEDPQRQNMFILERYKVAWTVKKYLLFQRMNAVADMGIHLTSTKQDIKDIHKIVKQCHFFGK